MRLLLLKATQIANRPGYYLKDSRWHKHDEGESIPKNVPRADHPHAAGKPVARQTLQESEWSQLRIHESNTNAGTFNRQLDQLKAAANAGDVTGILASGYGTNTYGKRITIIANHVLGLLGSEHRVTPGQKAGDHAAVQTAQQIEAGKAAQRVEAPKAKPVSDVPKDGKSLTSNQKAIVESIENYLGLKLNAVYVKNNVINIETDGLQQHNLHAIENYGTQFGKFKTEPGGHKKISLVLSKQSPAPQAEKPATSEQKPEKEQGKTEPAPGTKPDAELAVPDFAEGKQATGVKAHYERVAKNIIRAAKAGDLSALQLMPTDKGNTWKGKTDNSKKLMALHQEAIAHAQANKSFSKDIKQPTAEQGPKDGETKQGADGTLVFRDGRWHKQEQPKADKPAPKKVVVKKPEPKPAAEKPQHGAEANLNQIPWDKQLIHEDNKNSKSHNKRVNDIRALAEKGDIAGLEAMSFGTNTYAKRQRLLRDTAVAAIREGMTTAEAVNHDASKVHPEPTQAQKEAGNYQKGHIKVHGLDITIENQRGSERSGTRQDGTEWRHAMSDHYGYIKRTTGADGEHVDVYVGQNPDSDKVFVVDQVNAKGDFDEHKVMLGFDSQKQATDAYASNFDNGWKVGPVTEMSIDQFKDWLKNGDTTKPLFQDEKPEESGPQEGERNADGLVFRNGRWHRDEEAKPEPKAAAPDENSLPDDGLSDDPNAENYRFKDTGYIGGSRKEMAAQQIKIAAKEGKQVRATDVDWDEIEQNPRQAKLLITKSNLFGKVDWDGLKEGGMEPGAGFLVDRVYASVGKEPEVEGSQQRKDYAVGLESLRSRMEACKTPEDVTKALQEIHDEMEGFVMNEAESRQYAKMREQFAIAQGKAKSLNDEKDSVFNPWQIASHKVNQLKYEVEKRERRGWKPDPQLDAEYKAAQDDSEAKRHAYMKWREDHPEIESRKIEHPSGGFSYGNSVDQDVIQIRRELSEFQNSVRRRNLLENPVTRAWLTLGPRFTAVVYWRRYKGSDAFAGHVTNAKNGRVKDWSWAEKTTAPREATKQEVAFQLLVAENYERKGGREVSTGSTQALKNMFGLRDVQSGNWVLNDPNSARFHVQKASEAFADLADIVGVDDKLVSMNGRIAMAFGARGKGGKNAARAHYEPVQRVINITKMGGGGCLAHEWFHGLDNLVKEAEGAGDSGKDDFLSANPDLLPPGELRDAFRGLHAAMHTGDIRTRENYAYTEKDVRLAEHNISKSTFPNGVASMIKNAGSVESAVIAVKDYFDRYKLTPKTKKNRDGWLRLAVAHYDKNPAGGEVSIKTGAAGSSFAAEAMALDGGAKAKYWSSTEEMAARAFQSWSEDKLQSLGRRNDYLSAMADNKYYKSPMGDAKPFPEGEERKRINAAFDHLMAVLAKRGTLAKALALFA